jgi:hypothetical protein
MMQRGMSTVLLRGKVQTTGMRLLSISRSVVEAIYLRSTATASRYCVAR